MTAEPIPHQADPGTVDAENPWPGLAAFREADQELFYGREAETGELLRLVLRERLTVLFGLSGLGKTSLLQAGLFPRLRPENVLPIYIRLDFSQDLIDQVRQAVLGAAEAAGIEAPAFPATETLWESFHRQGADFWSPRNDLITPLLVFDQFEEIFTIGRLDEAFLTELADLCEGSAPESLRARLAQDPAGARDYSFNRHSYKILLSLREDFLPELEGLRDRIRGIAHNRLRLQRMHGGNALRVVTEAGGHLVEPGVPEKIVRFVAGHESGDVPLAELDVEPALLSVICRELNLKRRERSLTKITSGLLEGNREEILSDFYERSLVDLPPEVRTFVEERLLTPKGFRESVALDTVLEEPGVGREALLRLVDRRLLRIEDRGGMQRVELTHDVLAGVIRKSRDSRREREARERAEAARREAEERERQSRRKLRQSRALLAVFFFLFLTAVAAAWWGYRREQDARAAVRETQATLASSDLRQAVQLVGDEQDSQALAYLARSVRSDPDNVAARSLLLHLLLYRNWHLPRTVIRHEAPVWSVDLSRDGRFLVTIARPDWSLDVQTEESVDNVARIWNAATGRQAGLPLHHAGEVLSAGFSPDGRWVVTASTDKTARVWDAATGRPVSAPLPLASKLSGYAEFSPDGRSIVTASGTQARLWNARTGAPIGLPLQHPEQIEYALFSPDGRTIGTFSKTRVTIWNAQTGRQVPIHYEGRVASFNFSRTIVTILPDGRTVRLWDARTGLPGPSLRHDAFVRSAEPSPDGRLVATASENKARLWDAATGRTVGEPLLHPSTVFGAGFSPDGRFVLTWANDKAVRLWDLATGLAAGEPMRHDGQVTSARFSHDGKLVITSSKDSTARLWQVPTGRAGAQTFSDNQITGVALSPGGDRLALITVGSDVHIWNIRTGRRPEVSFEAPEANSVLFSADGRRLITFSADGVRAWDARSGKPLDRSIPLQNEPSFRVTADGQRVVTIAANGEALVRDVLTGRPLSKPVSIEASQKTEIDPTGRWAATVSPQGTRLWDLTTGRPVGAILRFEVLPENPFNGHGSRLITLSTNHLQVWDTATGRSVGRPIEHLGTVQEAVLSPDHKLLLVASVSSLDRLRPLGESLQNTARIWNLETGEPVGEPLHHEALLAMARFSNDGRRVITSTWDGSFRVWDVHTGLPLGSALRSSLYPGDAIRLDLTPDGQRLLANPGSTSEQIWDIPCGSPADAAILAELAEAIGGFTVGKLGAIRPLDERQTALLEKLRQDSAHASDGQATALFLARWLLADPWERTISPFSPLLVRDHLRDVMAHGDWDPQFLRDARAAFPGHPLLYPAGAGSQ